MNNSESPLGRQEIPADFNGVTITSDGQEMQGSEDIIHYKIGQARAISKEMVGLARTSTRRVDILGTEADDISKVIEVITEISEQTNMLAINAIIEASRAGEAGKRFSVTANEIKKLAKQTTLAAGEIKDRIESIRDSAEGSVDDIGRITGVINRLNEVVGEIVSSN